MPSASSSSGLSTALSEPARHPLLHEIAFHVVLTALHALLVKIRDLGLPLLAVRRIESDRRQTRAHA
jgi:hypothetical protein